MLWGHGKQMCLWNVRLMLSDKCLKLSQGSCPSFRLCRTSPLVDNSYTGSDWAVCSLKGLTLLHEAGVRWKKHHPSFNWNYKNIHFVHFTHLECKWNLHSLFLHWALSAQLLQCLPSHLVPWLQASFDKLCVFRKFLTRYFCTEPIEERHLDCRTNDF